MQIIDVNMLYKCANEVSINSNPTLFWGCKYKILDLSYYSLHIWLSHSQLKVNKISFNLQMDPRLHCSQQQ